MCKVFFVESDKSTQTIMKAWKIRGIFGNLKELGGIKNERNGAVFAKSTGFWRSACCPCASAE